MVDIAAQKVAEARRWAAMHIKADRLHEFDAVARKLVGAKARYQVIEAHLASIGMGVPWWAIAVWHERESGADFSKQMGQGDPLGEVSRNVPAGRGPFFGPDAFERSCYDALIDCAPHAAHWTDWTVGGAMTVTEEYNGEGYASMGRPSPYVWSGSDQYVQGKYVRDGVFDPNAVDQQLGCAPLLARMMAIDPSIRFADAPGKWTGSAPGVQPAKPVPPPKPPTKPEPAPKPEAPPRTWGETIRDAITWLGK